MNLSINFPDSPINLVLEKVQELYFLAQRAKAEGEAYGKEKAIQAELSKCYKIDELSGKTGRLKLSRSTILNLIHNNRLRFIAAGDSRGYVVSEKAVREFLGDL